MGLAHTVTADAWSHCAFTGKVQRLPAMMRPLGYEVIHYGVEGAQTAANEHVTIMSQAEQAALRGHPVDPAAFVGDDANVGNPLWREFNRRLRWALLERVQLRDLILLPFGHAHADAVAGFPDRMLVESGIGYPTLYAGARWKVFESYAWMHWHAGKAGETSGQDYRWVVPNYFDVSAWDFNPEPDPRTVVYMGRLDAIKGLAVVVEIAKRRPDLRFVLCGQGDPKPWLGLPNVEYKPPIHGRERSALLGSAFAVLMPSSMIEPFGGVAVESQLAGSPVLATDYGAFAETIVDGATGFRCHTLGDWLAGLARAPELNRAYISARARRAWGYERVGRMYDRVFRQIGDLWGEGWHSPRSIFLPPLKLPRPETQGADRDRVVPARDLVAADGAVSQDGGGSGAIVPPEGDAPSGDGVGAGVVHVHGLDLVPDGGTVGIQSQRPGHNPMDCIGQHGRGNAAVAPVQEIVGADHVSGGGLNRGDGAGFPARGLGTRGTVAARGGQQQAQHDSNVAHMPSFHADNFADSEGESKQNRHVIARPTVALREVA